MLFDDDSPPSPLVGIARLAREGELLEAKRSVSYRELPTRRFLTRCTSERVPFTWTINPYRGCEFGCRYCYARYTHEFMELRGPEDFERQIFAKTWDAAAFRAELARVKREESIAIGTATDPYQPAERRYRLTRKILLQFAGEEGRVLSLTTKSDTVAEDTGLLSEIARRNILSVNMTVTTTDEALARKLEPRAPRPELRFRALERLSAAGVRTGVFACPVMPLINDSEESLEAVAAAGKRAGIEYFHAHTIFLRPCSKPVFFEFLEKEYPRLLDRYRARFERAAFLRGAYPDRLHERVHAIRERLGIPHAPERYQPELWSGDAQLDLFAS